MDIRPQDEDGIVKMILRDALKAFYDQHLDLKFLSKVKLQKIVFIIAEDFDIPLTRSWYLYGGFIHNKLVDIETVNELDLLHPSMNDLFGNIIKATEDLAEIKIAEDCFQEILRAYRHEVSRITPKIQLTKMNVFLKNFYEERAPKEYRQAYLSNLSLQSELQKMEISFKREHEYETTLSQFVKLSSLPSTKFYKNFTTDLSRINIEVTNREFSDIYDYASRFIELFESYLIKLGYMTKGSLGTLELLTNVYKADLWKLIALKISINTLQGVKKEEFMSIQTEKRDRLSKEIPAILDGLEQALNERNMLASRQELIRFYEKEYGNKKEITDALVGVLKSYRG